MRSKMKVNGFSWRQGARYLAMNQYLTGEMDSIWELLPSTKSGARISMKNRALNSKKENLEENWCFSPVEPNEDQMREIVARVAEVGVRTIFENICYCFGGKTYQQQSGGPIGARMMYARGGPVSGWDSGMTLTSSHRDGQRETTRKIWI